MTFNDNHWKEEQRLSKYDMLCIKIIVLISQSANLESQLAAHGFLVQDLLVLLWNGYAVPNIIRNVFVLVLQPFCFPHQPSGRHGWDSHVFRASVQTPGFNKTEAFLSCCVKWKLGQYPILNIFSLFLVTYLLWFLKFDKFCVGFFNVCGVCSDLEKWLIKLLVYG